MALVRGLVRVGYREIRRKEPFHRKFLVVVVFLNFLVRLKFLKSTHTYAFIFSWPASLCKLEFALIKFNSSNTTGRSRGLCFPGVFNWSTTLIRATKD